MSAELVPLFARMLELCKLRPDESLVILMEPGANQDYAAAMYGAALWGLSHRLVQHPRTFLGVELALPRIPPAVEWACAALAAATFVAYGLRELRAIAREREQYPAAPLLYVLTQVLLFFVSYVLIESVTIGWIAVNLWHNAQYLLFVHAWNKRRFFGATRAEKGPHG